MSPRNGECVIGVPLVRFENHLDEYTVNDVNYCIGLVQTKPLAYILDAGKFKQVIAAEWVHKNLYLIGEL